ncbi:MAG: hypothetical protein ACKOTA_07300, partial [Solirubrobacterales bacterium]
SRHAGQGGRERRPRCPGSPGRRGRPSPAYLSAAPEVSGALLDAQHDHRRILEACRDGDGRAAALALADQYERTARGVFAGVDGDFAPAALDEAVASVRLACEN